MERILQALERARSDDPALLRDRVGVGDPAAVAPRLVVAAGAAEEPVMRTRLAPEPQRAPASPPASAPGPGRAPTPPRAEDHIVYSRTRSVTVDEALFLEKRVFVAYPGEPAGEAYRILSTQVLQRLRVNGWNALAVVSPGMREGKTLTAVNLAIGLSMEVGRTVLLVDADLRHPGVHEYFGLPPGPGLSEHLVHGTPLEQVLVNPGLAGLVVLPGGAPISSSSEMLGSPRMRELVQELKRRYPDRIVLFDLPPVLSAADALAFSPYVDGTIMVVEEGRTGEEDVLRAAELLESVNLIGTVLNNSRAARLHVDDRDERARARRSGERATRRADAGGGGRSRRVGAWLRRLLGRGGRADV